jgi:hypothetical protein
MGLAAFLFEAGATFNATSGGTRLPSARVCELIETEPNKAKALALAALMVQGGLDPNAGSVRGLWVHPEDRPIYPAFATGEPRLVASVFAAGADVRGWVDGDDGRWDGAWTVEFHGKVCFTPTALAVARGCPCVAFLRVTHLA